MLLPGFIIIIIISYHTSEKTTGQQPHHTTPPSRLTITPSHHISITPAAGRPPGWCVWLFASLLRSTLAMLFFNIRPSLLLLLLLIACCFYY
jgi:hypothetical protein